ncbi:MAG TPA: esterase-like activity of phytase family protein, partial [Chthoniobacterales bacterium]|nr:esterase-like activity of phytase family protein [Chthoniobacterales bacterium]
MITRVFLAAMLAASALRAEATLQAYGEIPASAKDSLGDTIGGIGSAIAYDPKTGDVFMMPDRGAGDGTIDYRPRCYRIKITPSAKNPKHLDCRVEETILFRDRKGRPFTGLLSDTSATPTRNGRRCLDSEAISIAPDGTIYVSDEYAPALLQFGRDGRLLREIPLPDWYRPRDRQGTIDYRAKTVTGREENRGCEAMGILPDGKHAVMILQSALVQDGGKSGGTSRVLILDLRTGQPTAEYAYAFADPTAWHPALKFKDLSVNDLTVVDKHTLLVLERDDLGRDGPLVHTTARYKTVWKVDLRGATN